MSQPGVRAKSPSSLSVRYQQTPIKEAAKLKGGKFISHLLGLDKGEELPALTGTAACSQEGAASRKFKISELLSGFQVTPNFLFFLLFAGFTLWIFVVYWIRHNEPFANQVLGSSKAHPVKSAMDRKLVAGIKNAYPVQTSSTTGEVYVPQGVFVPPGSSEQEAGLLAPGQSGHNGESGQQIAGYAAVDPALTPTHAGFAPEHHFGAPQIFVPPILGAAGHYPAGQYQGQAAILPHPVYGQAASAGHPAFAAGHGHYMVGVPSETGTKVKTIVNR